MASVLSVAEAKGFIPGLAGSIADASIQLAIDDVEQEIVDRFGPYYPGPVLERIYPQPGTRLLVVKRKIGSVTSIVEALSSSLFGGTTRTLATDDWRLSGSFGLERLYANATFPASSWSIYGVDVTYAPKDDTARRKMATVDVLKLELGFSGKGSIRIGDYAESSAGGQGGSASDGVTKDRTKILGRLRPKRLVLR